MSLSSTLGKIVKGYFVAGLLVVVPLIVTYLVLTFLFTSLDGILGPLIHKIAGFYWPGLGVLATLLLVLVAGVLTRNYLGTNIYRMWENLITKIPLIRPVYSGAKGLLQATTTDSAASFKEVVMIEYPREEVWTIGFVANRLEISTQGRAESYIAVYLPNTPTPFTGWTVIVPSDQVTPIDWTVEQAIKYVVSGGVVSPEKIGSRTILSHEKPEVPREAR